MRRLVCFLVAAASMTLVPARASAAPGLVIGLWPSTYTQFTEIGAASGLSLPYYRGRQRDGQFDRNLIESDAAAAAAAGYSLGLNIQPKTGSAGNRTGILYTEITAQLRAASGPYYDKLVSFANEVLALPTYGVVPNYLQFHSEASTQAAPGVPDAQPYSGTGQEYQECYALVRQLFDALRVTDKILWQIVLQQGTYRGEQGGTEAWIPSDPSLYDLVGVDGYYRSPRWRSPSELFEPALAFAHTVGKRVWIDETGSDEGGPTGSETAKAEWFASLQGYVEANRASVAGVVFNHATDGGNWLLDSQLQGGSSVPSYTGTSWTGWQTAVTTLLNAEASTRTLTVTRAGDGTGVVAADTGSIDCGPTCSESLDRGTRVTLRAHADPGSVFDGWDGAGVSCPGTDPCTVTVSEDTTVTAAFHAYRTLTLTSVQGTGTGSVTSEPSGIDCGAVCEATFPPGSEVVLVAAPAVGSFVSWSGDCTVSGTDPDRCAVTMDGARVVGAAFASSPVTLDVSKDGPASDLGRITSEPAGIDCGATCTSSFLKDSIVTLAAAASGGSTFVGWGGACSGTGPCIVTMSGATSVTGSFAFPVTSMTLSDADPAVAYNGWRGILDGAANGGAYRMSGIKDDQVRWTSPSATAITWVARAGPDRGKAAVTVDGRSKGTFDLYAASTGGRSISFTGLTRKAHDVVIKVLGTKSTVSTGFNVALDAFVVGGSTTQEDDPRIRLDTWQSTTQASATDGTCRSSTAGSASAAVTFTGTSIDWITRTGPANGRASVTIDGVVKGTVDLYRSTTTWRSPIAYGGLSSGPHTLVIRVLGQKNAAATSSAVLIDGFVVHG